MDRIIISDYFINEFTSTTRNELLFDVIKLWNNEGIEYRA